MQIFAKTQKVKRYTLLSEEPMTDKTLLLEEDFYLCFNNVYLRKNQSSMVFVGLSPEETLKLRQYLNDMYDVIELEKMKKEDNG